MPGAQTTRLIRKSRAKFQSEMEACSLFGTRIARAKCEIAVNHDFLTGSQANMDLLELEDANRIDLASKVDARQMTESEANLQVLANTGSANFGGQTTQQRGGYCSRVRDAPPNDLPLLRQRRWADDDMLLRLARRHRRSITLPRGAETNSASSSQRVQPSIRMRKGGTMQGASRP